jgi:membrane protein DedA with SNARE-associated domain
MFEQIVNAMTEYPYLVVGVLLVVCGLGLPLPEEIVLLATGYFCAKFPGRAELAWMMLCCGTSILGGDVIPFLAGRTFGTRLLRLRWLRYVVTRKRLMDFDRWFRRRGDLVIVIARFLAGIRVVAFFTAGTMKMPWRRFLLLDGMGIALLVPLLIWGGFRSAAFIDELIDTVQSVERGILWAVIGGGVLVALWIWLWRRRRHGQQRQTETFVQPQQPVAPLPECPPGTPTQAGATPDAPPTAAPDQDPTPNPTPPPAEG